MNKLAQQIEALPITLAGRFIYRFLPYRRRLIFSNISQVYNDQLNEYQKKRLAKAYYSHLAKSLKEALQLRFMSEKKLRAQVEVIGHEKMLAVVAQKKGVLVVTGHFGNWEFAPLGGVLNFKEFKGQFHFIRRTLRFKFIERIMFKNYYQAGLNVIPKKNSLEQVCVALEQNHAVIFVLDQHASLVNRDGIAVEFLEKKLAPTEAWRRYLAIQEFQLYLQPATDYLMESMFWSFMIPFLGKIMTLRKNLYTEIPWLIIRLWRRLFWHIRSSGIGCTNAGNFLK